MKIFNRSAMIATLVALFAFQSFGQVRYYDEVFSNITIVPNVQYGENYSVLTGAPQLQPLMMDIYYPADDVMGHPQYEATRPVIILMHAGSFLPKNLNQLPFGAKDDSSTVEMATQFAKRGWVAVSMTYRTGWNPVATDQSVRVSTIINAVYRAMQDSRACIRWFRKNAAEDGNTYRIDPYRVALGGSNSGGYIGLAVASLNKTSELQLFKFLDPQSGQSYVNQAITGGFYGEGGLIGVNKLNNTGYSSAPQVILNLGGAIGDTSWLEPGETPIVSLHGMMDALTPYGTQTVIVAGGGGTIPIVEVSGSHDLSRYANALGNHDMWKNANLNDVYTQVAETRSNFEGLFPFPGPANGFEPWAWYNPNDPFIDTTGSGFGSKANPWATKPKALAYIDTIMGYFTPRALIAFQNIDSVAVQTADPDTEPISSVNELVEIPASALVVGPNPAENNVYIQLLDARVTIERIRLFDLSGRMVRDEPVAEINNHLLLRNGLKSGMYIIEAVATNGQSVKGKVMFR